MSKKITGKWIAAGTITDGNLSSGAKSGVLASKLQAFRDGVLNKSVTGSSTDVSTEVLAAATTDTPITSMSAKGIYVGTVSNAIDPNRVMIRLAGTENGVKDDLNDDVYGVLTESEGVYTLSYKKSNGDAYSFSTSTAIDFYFIEVMDLSSMPVNAILQSTGVFGVVDAGSASIAASAKSSIDGHLDGGTSKHDASEIDYERADGSKHNIAAASDSVDLAIDNLDDAIGALAASPSNYTPADATVVASHLAAIDTALASAGGTSFTDSTFEIKNTAAPTKKINFSAANVTAGQTRTITGADRAVDLDNVTIRKTEKLTLAAGDITAKYKDLTVEASVKNPSQTASLKILGGIEQEYTVDFTIITDGTYIRRINWDGLGLEADLEAGDAFLVSFDING